MSKSNQMRLAILSLLMVVALSISAASQSINTNSDSDRVKAIRANNIDSISQLFESKSIEYPPTSIYMRAFKHEKELELWAWSTVDSCFKLIKVYAFTGYSGELGPKRKQGDFQIPEGIYHIDRFNHLSSYHLSLGINYPNKSDMILKSGNNAGGDIFIHGSSVTIGCIPIGDNAIEQLFIVACDTYTTTNNSIPVHIFPCRMDKSENRQMLERLSADDEKLIEFWNCLNPLYKYFENHNNLPEISINSSGKYILSISP